MMVFDLERAAWIVVGIAIAKLAEHVAASRRVGEFQAHKDLARWRREGEWFSAAPEVIRYALENAWRPPSWAR